MCFQHVPIEHKFANRYAVDQLEPRYGMKRPHHYIAADFPMNAVAVAMMRSGADWPPCRVVPVADGGKRGAARFAVLANGTDEQIGLYAVRKQ